MIRNKKCRNQQVVAWVDLKVLGWMLSIHEGTSRYLHSTMSLGSSSLRCIEATKMRKIHSLVNACIHTRETG